MKPQSRQGRGTTSDFIVRKPRTKLQPTSQPSHTAPRVEPVTVKEAPAPVSTQPKQRNKRSKRFKKWFFEIWRPVLIAFIVGTIVCLVLGYRIGSLTNGLSVPEQQYIASIDSGKELLSHPSFLVHKVPTYVLFKLGAERVAYYRLVSAAIGAVAVLSFFFVLRRWYSFRVSLLASWLLLTSAWLLHNARLATPESSFLLLIPLLWCAVWVYTTKRRQYAMAALFIVSVLCFYIPGFMWLVLGTLLWQRKTVRQELGHVKLWFKILAGFGVLLGLFPLMYGATQNPNELLLVSGLPASTPKLAEVGRNFLEIPMQLLLRGPSDPARWLGRLPLLDVFSTAMLALGIYSLRYSLRLIRTKLVLFAAALFVALIATGGPVTMLALLPLTYFFIAGGMAFMLQQWFAVFPRNPIARAIATSLMSALVLLVSFYHINHYFIAWSQTPASRSAFGQSLLK